MYVQYGCGTQSSPTWRNFDSSPTLRLQRLLIIGRCFSRNGFPLFPSSVEYGDTVKGLPIPVESCEAIYCSHVLEHLALEDCRKALKNTYSYLKHGGTFRLVVPDLETIAQDYVNSGGTYRFMEIAQLGRVSRPRNLTAMMREWLGSSHHLWMWDFKSLKSELETAGFENIRRAQYGDSSEAKFKEVELEDRWQFCLGMECLK